MVAGEGRPRRRDHLAAGADVATRHSVVGLQLASMGGGDIPEVVRIEMVVVSSGGVGVGGGRCRR